MSAFEKNTIQVGSQSGHHLLIRTERSGLQLEQFIRSEKRQRSAIVNIGLVDAMIVLSSTGARSLPDPFVRIKLGAEKRKSKTKQKTLTPYWGEEFKLNLYEDHSNALEIEVRSDETGGKSVKLGSQSIDLRLFEDGTTHHLELPLEDDNKEVQVTITFLLTLTFDQDRKAIFSSQSFSSLKDHSQLGSLEITIVRMIGLDSSTPCNLFCTVELDNYRLQTSTIYKTSAPEWNKTFTIPLNDIHTILILTVYDDKSNKKLEFVGKVALPLLTLKKATEAKHQLKNESLSVKAKGIIVFRADYQYSIIKAIRRTMKPKQKILMKSPPKLTVATIKNNIKRTQDAYKSIVQVAHHIDSYISWHSPKRSFMVLAGYIFCVLFIELYMVPLFLLFFLLMNLFKANLRTSTREIMPFFLDDFERECEEDEEEEGTAKGAITPELSPSEFLLQEDAVPSKTMQRMRDIDIKIKLPLIKNKIQTYHQIGLAFQENVGVYVSAFERVKNLFEWRVPWITSMAFIMLIGITLIMYLVPYRMLLIFLGVKHFVLRFVNPDRKSHSVIKSIISRVHCDAELKWYSELPLDQNVSSKSPIAAKSRDQREK